MNFKATASSIAASGGIRPDSHITARPVTATKAGPVALYFGGVPKASDVTSVQLGSARCGFAQPRLNLTGQRDDTAGAAFLRFVGTGGLRDGRCMSILDSRKPHAEKVWPRRSRQNKGAAPLTKAPSAFQRIGGAVRQGTLTIIGSNVRLGTEMPVALSSFWTPTHFQCADREPLVRKTGYFFQ
jgi:hypothetical protein